MYIVDGIAFSGEPIEELEIIEVKIVNDLSLLVTFNTQEQRLFDITDILKYPIYKELKDMEIVKTVKIEHGILVWKNGEIDISSEKVYGISYPYIAQEAN